LKDKSSLPISSIIGLYGPLEFIAYGGQVALAFLKEIDKSSVSGVDSPIGSNSTRRKLGVSSTINTATTMPLVFYGTAFAFAMLIIMNILWVFIYGICINKDPGYKEHKK
jgi:hypothetical protein